MAQHAQLTTEKSSLSPFDKIALHPTPRRLAIRMEHCLHGFPPPQVSYLHVTDRHMLLMQNLVFYAGMSVPHVTVKIVTAYRHFVWSFRPSNNPHRPRQHIWRSVRFQ